LNLCIPIERTQQSPEPEAKAKRGRLRIESITDDIVVKKARSRVKKELVDRGVCNVPGSRDLDMEAIFLRWG
jgi:hypothetical protein